MAFIQERRIVIPMEWLYSLVKSPFFWCLILHVYGWGLGLGNNWHTMLGVINIATMVVLAIALLFIHLPHSDWWEQSKKSDWIVMLKIKHSLFLFSGGYEIAGVRIPSFANSVLQCGQNQRIPSCGNSAGSVDITGELAHLWQLCCSCEHNQRKSHLWQSCHNVNIIRVSHHLWQ